MIAHCDTLTQLSQRTRCESLAQFGLPAEDHLDEFALVSFEVRQQSDLLHHLGAQVLCLVDEDSNSIATDALLKEEAVERLNAVELIVSGVSHSQIAQYGAKNLNMAEGGIQDECCDDIVAETVEHCSTKGCLP